MISFKSLLRGIGIYKYDVALSFAEEDRNFVRSVAQHLSVKGIRIFYDDGERIWTWGKDLQYHLDDIYREGAQFCVIFISSYYKTKRWSQFEQSRALARAFFSQNREYILPYRFDETEIAGLEDTIAYLAKESFDAKKLAEAIMEKLKQNRSVCARIGLWLKWFFANRVRKAIVIAIVTASIIFRLRDHFTPVDVLTERIHEASKHEFTGSACMDGHPSHSQGSGACSGHHGVDYPFYKGKYGKSLERCREEAEEISWLP